MVFYYLRNGLDRSRLGMVIGKKVFASAVQRNRLKRRLRYLFRRLAGTVCGFDIVIVARRGLGLRQYRTVERRFEVLAETLRNRAS